MAFVVKLEHLDAADKARANPAAKPAFTPDLGRLDAIDQQLAPNKTPALPKNLQEFLGSLSKPPVQAVSERAQAAGRGFTDIGEGLKQFGIEKGLISGDPIEYTKQRQAERNFYDTTPAGRDPLAQIVRGAAESSPTMLATGGPLGAGGMSLIEKILAGALGGGITQGVGFVQPGKDRLQQAAEGSAIGGALPLMPRMPTAASRLVGGIKSLLTDINPKQLAYGAQRVHDRLLSQAHDIYDFIKDQAVKRGVNNINTPKALIDEASRFLPNTRPVQKLLTDAGSGDYEALHALQSDLGKRGFTGMSADMQADRNAAEEMLDTRSKINDLIRDHFRQHGHPDLANMLDDASQKYRNIKEAYYSHPQIAKMMDTQVRKVASNPLTLFSEDSVPMRKFTEAHPEIREALRVNQEKQMMKGILRAAGKVGTGVGGVAGGLYLGSRASNLFQDDNT